MINLQRGSNSSLKGEVTRVFSRVLVFIETHGKKSIKRHDKQSCSKFASESFSQNEKSMKNTEG